MWKKFTIIFTVVFFILPQFANAENTPEKLTLNLEQTVTMGLNNSIQIQQVQNQVDIASINKERAEFNANEIESAQHRIWSAQKKIYAANSALNAGVLPSAYGPFKAGTPIATVAAATGKTESDVKSQISTVLNDKSTELSKGENGFQYALSEASDTISDKLGFSSLTTLNSETTSSLLTAMADTQYDVTNSSTDIYTNQIALLIQKSYYDVLQSKKIFELKNSAVTRAITQYNFAKDGFENGMKAKDDMLLAQTYYNSTLLELEKSKADYNNAVVEFKKNTGISYDKDIELTEVLAEKPEQFNIADGISSGFANRLEMKKALGQVMVYDLNFDIIKKTEDPKTFQYREAVMLKSKSKLELQKAQQDVEASIHSSYNTLQSTANMIETVDKMVKTAQETLEIAQYKYKEGFSSDNSLLSKMNLSAVSGTIVEVLAAEESLSEIESKRVQIIYGYNLSKMKYLNDTGVYTYGNKTQIAK